MWGLAAMDLAKCSDTKPNHVRPGNRLDLMMRERSNSLSLGSLIKVNVVRSKFI